MSADRIAELKAKIAGRRNKPGFAENVREMEAELARLEGKD